MRKLSTAAVTLWILVCHYSKTISTRAVYSYNQRELGLYYMGYQANEPLVLGSASRL